MAGKKITCTFFVGGQQVDKLSPEQCERMAKRVGETLSAYYSSHINEYIKINLPAVQEG